MREAATKSTDYSLESEGFDQPFLVRTSGYTSLEQRIHFRLAGSTQFNAEMSTPAGVGNFNAYCVLAAHPLS
ncbi:hypothetical protein M513_03504 [Trichuris suis]|uniref:Uncharacterized protein n=1 Tax=Trichuris suis TaxID=68888 RepID=A0A085MEW0_9BILA|nr:hypothetical protein M513_03504 [Trichuris suis]